MPRRKDLRNKHRRTHWDNLQTPKLPSKRDPREPRPIAPNRPLSCFGCGMTVPPESSACPTCGRHWRHEPRNESETADNG